MTAPRNRGLASLSPYPFERLRELLAASAPPAQCEPIPLSIGEPRHAAPGFVLDAYRAALREGVSRYPAIRGSAALREACAGWLRRRFGVRIDADTMIHPVAGTREGLFAAAQAFVASGSGQTVLMPNPFYQIYEGAALLAGAEPDLLNVRASDDFLPDLDAIEPDRLARAALFYLCHPVNPCGSVAPLAYLRRLVELAREHQFVIVADECYIELYRGQPPVSILNACQALGDNDYRQVLAFHSLSKRSNLPGLRSGFVAGDQRLIEDYGRYRTYHGCSLSLAVEAASIAAWNDDAHVDDNRQAYDRKYAAAMPLLASRWDVSTPPATFYVWLPVGGDDRDWVRRVYEHTGVTTVPGQYLSRTVGGVNPGRGWVRLSLVADESDTIEAIERLVEFQSTHGD